MWHPASFLLAVRYDTGALVRIPLRDPSRLTEAREVRREEWPVEAPTTVAVTPHGSYAVSGRLPELLGGSISEEFDLRRC